MTLKELNNLPENEALKQFSICCGASKWVEQMRNCRPFQNKNELLKMAEETWFSLSGQDWLEAFSHHPKIGDIESLRSKFQKTAKLSEFEQKGISHVSENILREIEKGNQLYENNFGYIFIVCATGKTAEEMLVLINERLKNDPEAELLIAANEQNKITRLRLEKLFDL